MNQQQEFVYFVTFQDGPIKIGRARNVRNRLKALQISLPHQLEVMGVMKGGHQLESSLHKRFADLRLKGEWFSRGTNLIEYISQSTKPLHTIAKEEEVCSECRRLKAENAALRSKIEEAKDFNRNKAYKIVATDHGEDLIRMVTSIMAHFAYRLLDLLRIMKDIESEGKLVFSSELDRRIRRLADIVFGLPANRWAETKHLLTLLEDEKLDGNEIEKWAVEFLFSQFSLREVNGLPLRAIFEKHLNSLRKTELPVLNIKNIV